MSKNLKSPIILGVVSSISATIIVATLSWSLYQHTVTLLTDNLRNKLLAIVTTTAANINPEQIQELVSENDWQKPAWRELVISLKKVKNRNKDIVFMYIFRKNPKNFSELEFVADAESLNPLANTDNDISNDVDANGDGLIEPDGADLLQWPSQKYIDPPDEAWEAFKGPITSKDLYNDSFGSVLTGYEPIYDSTGKIIAILAADIRANDFLTITTQTLYPFVLFIIVLVIIIFTLSWILISIWNARLHIIQELDRQKTELLAIVSHQLAKPITALKWEAESLLDGDLGVLAQKQQDEIKRMHAQSVNLADLVSTILDVSHIQLGKVDIKAQPLELKPFFSEIVDIVRPTIAEKAIRFVETVPAHLPTVLLDKRYTRMTIENLLTNAVKYTPQNGAVTFEVTINEENIMRVRVADTGVGIPKDEQSKIFGKMYRASNVRNAAAGNGFGLYVAKGAIEAQGGSLWFTSVEGKGTSFFVDLPLKIASTEQVRG